MASQSTTGLPRNTAAALAVVLAPTVVGTIVIMFLEKDSFVRFYSVQILLSGILIVASQQVLLLFNNMRVLSFLSGLAGLLSILGFVIWLVMIYRAWQGDEWEVPIIGNLARLLINKLRL